ncbi:hypothetical protein [Desulfomonile tiedjei]|uniref:Uncharacterized protein n=1 Tax=Desulfomonile tiedjei (strain ATCC 49306 / DSM 6799 / DCB-1) TaxID=706587 RepID=I4C9I1_DESTA|nr:hypothetical protein [Desulfomonile tiedjei]AFM26222.1 hypothetical protein Desti_3574 [Desulfomonile tiedjei DSM 6799]
MIARKKLFLLIFALLFCFMSLSAHAAERYGPWKYYAPYYFPPNGCHGECWSPCDFLPVYESPLPARPSYDTGGRVPKVPAPIRKVAPNRAALHFGY